MITLKILVNLTLDQQALMIYIFQILIVNIYIYINLIILGRCIFFYYGENI